jgi:hypothetical protein
VTRLYSHYIYPYTKERWNSIRRSTSWKATGICPSSIQLIFATAGNEPEVSSDYYLTRKLDFQAPRSSVLIFRWKRCYGHLRHRHKKLFSTSDFTCTNKTPVQRNSLTKDDFLLAEDGKTTNTAFFVHLRDTKNADLKVIAVQQKLWITSRMISGLSVWHTCGTCSNALTNTPVLGVMDLDSQPFKS